MTEARVNNLLTAALTFKLCKWMESTADQLQGKTAVQAAKIASDALGFRVTEGNIRGAKEVTGVAFSGPRGSASHTGNFNSTSRSTYLARQIVELRRELGLPIPDALAAIASKRAMPKDWNL